MKREDLEILRNRIMIYNQNKQLGLLDKMDKQTILENEALKKLLTAYEKQNNIYNRPSLFDVCKQTASTNDFCI